MTDLVARFVALPSPTIPGGYSVEDIGSNCRLGKSYGGHPAVLVSLARRDGAGLQRRLANLVYAPPATVEVRSGKKQEQAQLAIVECRVNERHLVRFFFQVVTQIIAPEAASGSEARFEAAIDAVATLFKSLQAPGSRTVQGLWAELAVIAAAAEPQRAFASWHTDPRALHDFTNGGFKLEVKSSSRNLREHAFLLDQLTLGLPNQTLIASLIVTELEGGCSVNELSKLIADKLKSQDARNRLLTIVTDALGSDIESADTYRFDLDSAIAGLQLYRAEAIPRPEDCPAEVKRVSFTADLTSTPVIALEEARRISKQFSEILPTLT